MKDLGRHIEFLLCEHDSVAIPSIGVFVTEELPARYYPKENLFLPPVRSVRLDTSNKEDDHKLEDCLVRLHHVNRSVASKWIAEFISDINQSLMDMGVMDMGTIGRLVYADGKITFEVCEAGVNTPELYGLDSFHMAKLPSNEITKRQNSDPTHFTIRLRRSTIHRVMTAAAMIIVALTVILPNYHSFNSSALKADFCAMKKMVEVFLAPATPAAQPSIENPVATTAEPVIQESDIVVAEPAPELAETPAPEAEVEETTEVAPLEVKGYCIVMASAVTHKGADYLIEKLNKEGFTNAVKYMDKGMLRVLLVGYNNKDMARASAAVVRATDDLYSGSWIKEY